MYSRAGLICLALLLTVYGGLGNEVQPITPHPQLVMRQSVGLTKADDGLDGAFVVYEDERISDSLRANMWGHSDYDMAMKEGDPRQKDFSSEPLLRAEVRLQDFRGSSISTYKFERPLAHIDGTILRETDRRFWMVTVDFSTGFGSYGGPVTYLFDISKKELIPESTLDTSANKRSVLSLLRSLKSDWKVRTNGAKQDILVVNCAPNSDASEFIVIYTRFHFMKDHWETRLRRAKGFWENDQPFPPDKEFPAFP